MATSVCRVCLVGNTSMMRVHSVLLLEMYEKLTNSKLTTETGMPSTLCFICYCLLQRCCRFSDMAHKSNRILQYLLHNGTEISHNTTLQLTPNSILSLQSAPPELMSIDPETITSVTEKQAITEKTPVKIEKLKFNNVETNAGSDYNYSVTIKTERVDVKEEIIDNEDADDGEKKYYIEFGDNVNNYPDITSSSATVKIEQDATDNIGEERIKPVEIGNNSKEPSENHDNVHTNKSIHPRFICNVCNKVLSSKNYLVKHLQFHSDIKPYTCTICDKVFTVSHNLIKHMRNHTGERPYTCNLCNKSFIAKTYLTTHMRIHTGEKRYSCNSCSRMFTQEGDMKIHLRTHTGHKPHLCKMCHKGFTSNSQLTKHMRIHTGQKPYSCNSCDKSFTQNGSLKIHKRLHTGEKPHLCKICNRAFTSNSQLTKHMRVHTGEKPYKCNVCNKSFAQNGNFKIHMRSHTGVKPYTCNRCNKSFTTKSYLTKHTLSQTCFKYVFQD